MLSTSRMKISTICLKNTPKAGEIFAPYNQRLFSWPILSEDVERLTGKDFIHVLEVLGEKYWAEKMRRLHEDEKTG